MKHYYPNQRDHNDLIRDLNLNKFNAEIFTSEHLLDKNVKVTVQGICHNEFANYFTNKDGLCFCNNATALFAKIGIKCNPHEWSLFIDSSCKSLRDVLLHNCNKLPSKPLAHSAHLKEKYSNVNLLIETFKYDQYGWEVIGDFKMIAVLTGLQGGFIKFQCYLCLYISL